MGIREALRSLKRQANEDMDYLTLRDGTRHYFDPQKDPAELYFETMRKSYLSSEEVETPEIRAALAQATPESIARFEEKYQIPVTQEVNVVGTEDRQIVRRIALDGSVRSFLLEGEAARERRANARAAHPKREPLDLSREGVREINPKEESELLEVEDLSEPR
jgi:hypothetical protein